MKDINDILAELDNLMHNGDQNAVEKRFLELLDNFESNANAPDLEYITILNELAGWYRGISRYQDSEDCYNQLIKALENMGMQGTIQYARILLNLAGLYRLTGRFNQSLDSNSEAKTIIARAAQKDEYAMATALNSTMLTYQAMGDLVSAKTIATKSLEFVQSSSVASDHEIATALNNLASICVQLGELDDAEQLIAKALDIYAEMPEENIHHGAALTTMGTILFCKGDFLDALNLFQDSSKATERFFGRNIEFAAGQYNLAKTYQALGNLTSAIDHQQLAVETIVKLLGSNHPHAVKYSTYLKDLQQKAALSVKDGL